jgi:lipopolysaccharide export system permease protein
MRIAHARPGGFGALRLRLLGLERYVLRRTLTSVAGALGIIGAVIMLIDFVSIARDVGARAELGFFQLLGLTAMKSPSTVLMLLPFVFLFGTLAAFVQLNRKSELVAMRAAGVSAWRFIFPAAGAAMIAGVLTVAALNPLASWLTGRYEATAAGLLSAGPVDPKPDTVWLREGAERQQVVIRASRRVENSARLQDVSMFFYRLDTAGRLDFSHRIDAREAELKPGGWELRDARESRRGQVARSFAVVTVPSTLEPDSAFQRFATPNSAPFWALPGLIQRIRDAGFSATAYQLRLHQLLATPLLFAAMSVLAAAFSLRLLRLGGLAGLAGAGVALGFLLFFFNEFCEALGMAEILPAALAAWAPPVLALLSGFTLLCYTEDG